MTSIGAQIHCWSPIFSALAAITVGVAVATVPTSVLAEAQIRGTVEAVSVETKNSSLKEVLAALSDAFDVHYRSVTDLERQINGTYTGSLEKVLKRVLDGYSFFVKIGDGGIELTVLESSNAAPAIEASPSFEIAGRPAGPTPAEASPEVAVVTPSAPPALQSIPTSRELRGHHLRVHSAQDHNSEQQLAQAQLPWQAHEPRLQLDFRRQPHQRVRDDWDSDPVVSLACAGDLLLCGEISLLPSIAPGLAHRGDEVGGAPSRSRVLSGTSASRDMMPLR